MAWLCAVAGCGGGAGALASREPARPPGATLLQAAGTASGAAALTLPPPSSAAIGHLENPDRLTRLYEALAALDDGHAHDDVRILQYGDSHTASDVGSAVFRRILQARFGDGGRGFVALGRPWKGYVQDGIHGSMTKEFEPERPRLKDGVITGDGSYGLLGVAIGATKSGARASTDVGARSSRIEIAYWRDPQGGSAEVFVDGARAGRFNARADPPGPGFLALDVADASHEVEVQTVSDGEVRVFGMALDRSQAGVVVDALGINGAQIFTALRWDEGHFAEQLRHRIPDAVVLAYGTNEALDPSIGDPQYERGLVDLLGRIARAAPGASCVLLGPPDLGRRAGDDRVWATWPRVYEIVTMQRRVAGAAGCAFYDQVAAMGGPGSILGWAAEAEPRGARDRVHLTRTGYAELATAFATDLLRGYDAWRAERGLAPTGASRTWAVTPR